MALTNVAKNKRVNALGSNTSAITDGITNANVHWDGGVAPENATVDLDGYYKISEIRLVTYYGDGRYYRFKIYAGTSASDMQLVAKESGEKTADEKGYVFEISPVTARYVKVEMLYNSANPSVHIADLQVMGELDENFAVPEKKICEADPEDIAFGKPTKAGTNSSFSSLVTDGDPDSCWIGELYPRFVDVDLQKNYFLDRVVLTGPAFAGYDYAVYTAVDGVNFDKVGEGKTSPDQRELTVPCAGKLARVIRVLAVCTTDGAGGASALCQVKAYGKESDTAIVPTRTSIYFENYEQWLLDTEGVDLEKIKDEKGQYDIKDSYTAEDTVKAIRGLVTRVLGERYNDWFSFVINREAKENYYILEEKDGKIVIEADCGVSAATGLNFYLKYYCHVQVSQQTKQVNMPAKMPQISGKVSRTSPYEVRYAYNYCTLSYTMPFFGYENWQRELDYLMLSGVNLILDLTATEALWVSYLQKLGYTADEAKNYVCGYCYKAWWLMGNLEGYGGPVADAWIRDTLNMARINQRYMTVMGAQPALQTFVGAMPESFATLASKHLAEKGFGEVSNYLEPQGLWAGGFVRPNVLKTTYPGYSYLAELFYETQNEVYGQVSDYYCGDVCHEGGIVPADLSKPEMSAKILNELLKADKKAVWMLQGWWSNPMKEVLDGFGSLKQDHVLILDLAALANPKWTNTKTWDGVEFGSTPWIFCILDNYGGRTGMHGKLREMAELMDNARKQGKVLKGIGITPEGTNANPVVFDLFWEMGWRDCPPDIRYWLYRYAERRYGKLTEGVAEAWKLFEQTVYGVESYDGTTKNNVINEDADLGMKSYTGRYYKIGYSRTVFEEGVLRLMEDYEKLKDAEGYVYDVVDLLRMTLTIACDDYFEVLKRARILREAALFERYSDRFLDAMKLVSELSAYNKDEMLGNWIGRGQDFAADARNGEYAQFDLDMMEYNARILLTTWASSPITNYANRQFDGLMDGYFIKMWETLLNRVKEALEKGSTPPEELGKECFEIGWQFNLDKTPARRCPADPEGSGKDRGLLAIFRDVEKHMNDRTVKEDLAALDAAMADLNPQTGNRQVSSTIATNIEH